MTDIDSICVELQHLGIQAEVSVGDRPELAVLARVFLGLIDIAGSPIQWVFIRNTAMYDESDYHYAKFGIPDSRLRYPQVTKPEYIHGFPSMEKAHLGRLDGKE